MPLTPEAKRLLAETIRGTQQDPARGLRARLLRDLHDEADRRYRLSVPIADAGLDEAHRRRRERIEAWVDERARAAKPKNAAELKSAKARLLAQAQKHAAATLINRLVLLRHLEALGLSKPAILTGGWDSKGYREFRAFAPALCTNGATDATEGYATLLQLLFDELAIDLPGLFGDVGLTRLFPIPASTLREVVERLDAPDLASAWTDDTTLGWVYQYWNDPDREELDAKINAGGKIQPHEIASKTQMFTERYMVEWLLQNSLGLTWLCMCKKHGWTADAEKVLPVLEARRVEWRRRRDAGEVALDALMPIEGELEDHWKYFVPQPLPEDAVETAPDSVRSLKILDPACGSGHFLVIAFGLLTALYREEARHRGETISDREITESILENNLHGIDIDPRAIQIAAAALYLKGKSFAKDARPKRLNLVAPVLQLGNLPPDDPAVVQLREDLRLEVGIPAALTDKLLKALAGVDYLGSLLKVDDAVEKELRAAELEFERQQGNIFNGFPAQQIKLSLGQARASVLDKLEAFLSQHSKTSDLGLRLDGEQLAAGVRFVRMAKEDMYDIVVGNPPYQRLSKTQAFGYVTNTYSAGNADLYAAFLKRGLELARPNGISALLTMRGWMFLGKGELRRFLVRDCELVLIGDVDRGAFEEVPDEVLSTVMSVFRRARRASEISIAVQPTPLDDRARDAERTARKRAALLLQVGRHEFDPRGFEVIDGEPIVYWWSKEFLTKYGRAPKLGQQSPARATQGLYNNTRFTRWWHEVPRQDISGSPSQARPWTPFTNGSDGAVWFEPLRLVAHWGDGGIAPKSYVSTKVGTDLYSFANERFFFRDDGVAFSMIGAGFTARLVRQQGTFGDKGRCVFSPSPERCVCLLNSQLARYTMESLNPSISFQAGDVNRVAVFTVASAEEIVRVVEAAFYKHEAAREPSLEFKQPGPSAWRYAQHWAQMAVDRAEDVPVPRYDPQYDPPTPEGLVSFAIGIAVGRFGAAGEGISEASHAFDLSGGILFVTSEGEDSLGDSPCAPIHAAWREQGSAIGEDLRHYLCRSFFEYHKKLYENRPIYFPLSSAKRSFVAFVSIHRWQDDTLNVLLADHLVPARRRLEGELEDLRTARASGANKGKAEKRFAEVQKLLEELNDFIGKVTEIAEKGPPPPDDKTPRREVDARYVMDLDDGVMVNSAALWPLLEPQWKDPKKWWKELATAQGKKDYDWSHLAARYFPSRARKKCGVDPSLAVAHRCFWEMHPGKAYAWELRLQDEIRPDFTIDETGSDAARTRFLAEHAGEAAAILAAEMKRRARKAAQAGEEDDDLPLFEPDGEEPEAEEKLDD